MTNWTPPSAGYKMHDQSICTSTDLVSPRLPSGGKADASLT